MQNKREMLGGAAIAMLGLVVAVVGVGWLTGTLGVSAVAAQAIAKAVEVGSWAMFLVAIAATGGIVGAGLWGVLKLILWRAGKAAVVA